MLPRIIASLAISAIALPGATGDRDGFLPAEATLVTLATLPAAPAGAPTRTAVRLSATGRPMILLRGRLVMLAEQPDGAMADWTPPAEADSVRDFCWLDEKTLVLLRGNGLDFIRDGKPVRAVALPSRGMRLARADATHCYLFGGERPPRNREVLLFGADGSLRNLFQAPAAVTAVAGDGGVTFVAAGPVVYSVARGARPRAVFREHTAITQLAYAPPVGVFYVTSEGVGFMAAPGSGAIFLQGEIASADGRGGRLLLLTKEREVLLISPIAGFPRVIREVRRAIADEGNPEDAGRSGRTPSGAGVSGS